MQISLTQQEAKALFDLIDIAVKAAGINVALSAAILAKKIDDAAKAEREAEAAAQKAAADSK